MTKVNGRQSLPALDNSKSVKNPDLLNIADKNYASTILRYSNLAILYSQLDTQDKHIVGAINEINKKVQPAKYEGQTDVVGGVIIGDGLSVTEDGVLSVLSESDIYVYKKRILSSDWRAWGIGGAYDLVIPKYTYGEQNILLAMCGNNADTYNERRYGLRIDMNSDIPNGVRLVTALRPARQAIQVAVMYWGNEGVIFNPVYTGFTDDPKLVVLPASGWNSSTHIIRVSVEGVTSETTQLINGMPADSALHIQNNAALQAANLQDVSQGGGYIELYAENIPTQDLSIMVTING